LLALYQKINDTMPWAPYGLASIASQVLAAGAWPRLRQFPPTDRRPAWLADDNRYTQWRQLVTGPYKSIDMAFLAQNSALAAAETQAATANADFWNTIAKYSGVDALEGLWQDLQNALSTIKAQREAAQTSLATAATIIAAYPGQVPANYVSQTSSLTSQLSTLDSKARSILAPIPTAAKEAGLSGLPLIVAGITAATVAAVAASAWAIAAEFTSVQKNAAANAQAIIKWRETQDAADYAAGRINNQELMARRNNNIAAANSVVAAQGAAAVGSAFGAAGRGIGSGIAMAVGGIAALGLVALLIVRFAKPKASK
jgi:hypothetical protein